MHLVAGKSTLLQILAGQYMVGPDVVRILGRPAFHDIQLTSSGQLSYLGQQWRRDVAFAGYNVPIQVHTSLEALYCYIFMPPEILARHAVSTALACGIYCRSMVLISHAMTPPRVVPNGSHRRMQEHSSPIWVCRATLVQER